MQRNEIIGKNAVQQLIENQLPAAPRGAALRYQGTAGAPRGGGPRVCLSAPACEATPHFGAFGKSKPGEPVPGYGGLANV